MYKETCSINPLEHSPFCQLCTKDITEIIAIQRRLTFNPAVPPLSRILIKRGEILRVYGSGEILNASSVRRILEARSGYNRAEIDSPFKTALNTY